MHSPIWGTTQPAITQQPLATPKRVCTLSTPGFRPAESFRQPRTGCGYPGVAAPKKPGHQGEPQGIDAVRGQQVRSETGATDADAATAALTSNLTALMRWQQAVLRDPLVGHARDLTLHWPKRSRGVGDLQREPV